MWHDGDHIVLQVEYNFTEPRHHLIGIITRQLAPQCHENDVMGFISSGST